MEMDGVDGKNIRQRLDKQLEQPDEEQTKNCKLETYASDDEELEEGEVEEDEVDRDSIDEWTIGSRVMHIESDRFYTNHPQLTEVLKIH